MGNADVTEQMKLQSMLLGNVAQGAAKGKCVETAIAMARRAVNLDPLNAARRLDLAAFLVGAGEDHEAETIAMSVAIKLPDIDSAWSLLGVINTHRGRLKDATDCFERALQLNPNNGQSKFNLAAGYLRSGDWTRGWEAYADRREVLPPQRLPSWPAWDGSKVSRILCYPDQGYGDAIMFARYLPLIKERCGAGLVLMVDPAMVPLMQGYRGIVDDVVSFWKNDDKFDAQFCLADAPRLFGTTPSSIPQDPGVLTIAPSANGFAATGLKIGIAWSGNRDHPNDDIRSMRFEDLLPLVVDPGNDVFSLQCGPSAADVALARAQRVVGDMSGMIEGEWTHTAAVVKQLDLVVTVDTALAHLAGALRVPTFLMLPRFSDWRWLWGREDTPWYHTVRLFRQERVLDWKGVVTRVCEAVTQMHRARGLAAALRTSVKTKALDPHRPGTADEKEPEVAHVLKKVLRPGDTFIDVGANVGMHSKLASGLVGGTGLVIAIEPGTNVVPELTNNLVDSKNVKIVTQPAWNREEDLTFHLCAEGSGGNAVWDPGMFPTNERSRAKNENYVVRATTIDVVLDGRNPRLIKIDVEGAEQRVLEGALTTLLHEHPSFIVAELHEFGLQVLGCSQSSLRSFMYRMGYDTYMLYADGTRPKKVPEDEGILSRYIINILFSTDVEVESAWSDPGPAVGQRTMRDYDCGPGSVPGIV